MKDESNLEPITLTDEDGNETQYDVVLVKEIDNNTYYVLLPLENNDDEDYVLLKYVEQDGEPYLITIDDDDEFDKVADAVEDELFVDDDETEN